MSLQTAVKEQTPLSVFIKDDYPFFPYDLSTRHVKFCLLASYVVWYLWCALAIIPIFYAPLTVSVDEKDDELVRIKILLSLAVRGLLLLVLTDTSLVLGFDYLVVDRA